MKKDISEAQATGLAVSQEVPAYLQDHFASGEKRGSENVEASDVVIPRLDLVQGLSACKSKKDPGYIEGIVEGDFYNNVSRKNYGENVLICPVFFKKEWLVWKDRSAGGGFGGAYASAAEAQSAIAAMEDADDLYEAVETAQHFVLVIDKETGETEPVVLSMAKSKLKASRQLNSLVRMQQGDRWASVYEVSSVEISNDKGNFFTIAIKPAGFPSEVIYKKGTDFYSVLTSGKNVAASRDYENQGETTGVDETQNDDDII